MDRIFKSMEILGCLGALMLFLLVLCGNGLLFWLLGQVLIWVFNIDFHYTYLQAFCVGIVWSILKIITVGDK